MRTKQFNQKQKLAILESAHTTTVCQGLSLHLDESVWHKCCRVVFSVSSHRVRYAVYCTKYRPVFCSNFNYGIFSFTIVRYIPLIPLQRGNLTEGFPPGGI